MPRLIIKGTPIQFPSSGQSPNWAPAVIEAIEALTDAVNSISGTFDIPPQVQNIDSPATVTDFVINNLSFPFTDVRSALIFYTVHRATEDSGPPDGQELTEEGTLEILYNSSNLIGQKWSMIRTGQGDAHIDFSITDLGQLLFTTTALTGINHTGIVSFRAIAVLNE